MDTIILKAFRFGYIQVKSIRQNYIISKIDLFLYYIIKISIKCKKHSLALFL